jgi:RsiW-degrading membrane proteinase PrsW (M82 family)
MGEITADLPGIIFIIVVDSAAAALWLAWLGEKERSFPRFRSPRWFYPYFVLGALSGIVAAFLELSFLFDPYSELGGFWGVLGYNLLAIGLIEEGAKFCAVLLVIRVRDDIREPFDGAVAGATAGLGFAILENAAYGLYGDAYLTFDRSFFTIQGHMLFSMFPALFYAKIKLDSELRDARGKYGLVAFGLVIALLLHGLRNSILELSGNIAGAFLMDLALLCALAALINRVGDESPYRTYPWREWSAALEAIQKGLDVDPDNPNLLLRRGMYNLAAGRWVDACVAFDGVVETGKRLDLARSFYAAALLANGERESAEELFGEHWPSLNRHERAVFMRSLERALLSRAVLRAEIRDLARKSAWTPRG